MLIISQISKRSRKIMEDKEITKYLMDFMVGNVIRKHFLKILESKKYMHERNSAFTENSSIVLCQDCSYANITLGENFIK